MSVDAVPSSHRPSTRPAVPASPFLEWNHDQQTPSHAGFDAVIGVRATNRLGTGQTWKSLLAGRSRIGGEHQQLGLPRRRPHVYKRRACSPCACCWCRSRCQSDDSPHPVAPLIQEAPSCQTPNHKQPFPLSTLRHGLHSLFMPPLRRWASVFADRLRDMCCQYETVCGTWGVASLFALRLELTIPVVVINARGRGRYGCLVGTGSRWGHKPPRRLAREVAHPMDARSLPKAGVPQTRGQ